MAIYLVIIFFSSILLFLMDKVREKNIFLSFPFVFITLLILSVVGGLRNPEMTYDFFYYCAGHFNMARSLDSLGDFIAYVGGGEWAYSILIYTTAAFTNDYHAVMFVLTLFTTGMALWAAIKTSDKAPAYITFTLFLLFNYVNSFNLIRQSLAVSSVWLAFSYYKGRNGGLAFWLLAIVSFGFHKSSVAAIMVIWAANYFSYCKNPKKALLLITIAAVLGSFSLQIVIGLLAQSIPMFERYMIYVTGDTAAKWARPTVNKSFIILTIVSIGVSFFALRSKTIDFKFFIVCIVLIYALACGTSFGRFTESATRICMFFVPLVCVKMAEIFHSSAGNVSVGTKTLCQAMLVLAFVAYCINGVSHAGYFYSSRILGF